MTKTCAGASCYRLKPFSLFALLLITLPSPMGGKYELHYCLQMPQFLYSLIAEKQDEALNELTQGLLSSSDSESEGRKHGGSFVGRARNIDHTRQRGHEQLYKDYLYNNPVYIEVHFRRRFRISRNMFQALCQTLGAQYYYFLQRPDCRGMQGFST